MPFLALLFKRRLTRLGFEDCFFCPRPLCLLWYFLWFIYLNSFSFPRALPHTSRARVTQINSRLKIMSVNEKEFAREFCISKFLQKIKQKTPPTLGSKAVRFTVESRWGVALRPWSKKNNQITANVPKKYVLQENYLDQPESFPAPF